MSKKSHSGLVFSDEDIAVIATIRGKDVVDVDENGLTNIPTQEVAILVNDLQRVLDLSRSGQAPVSITSLEALSKFRSRVIRLLVKLSRHHAIFPKGLFVEGVKCTQKLDPVYSGGFGDIFRGTIGDAMVAIKRARTYTDDRERSGSAQDMLRKEAILWRQLKHPHVLPFLGIDAKTFAPLYAIVSPWMKNGNLLGFLERNEPTRFHINHLLIQIAQGLQYLHEQRIVHGDLRAANVLVNDTLQACVADFGLARVLSVGLTPVSTPSHETSARWLAPELLAGDKITVTFEGDVFAFGRVCLEAYTLKVPFWYIQREVAVVAKILAGEDVRRPTLEETCSRNLSDKMWKILKLCWKKAPLERPSVPRLIVLLKHVLSLSDNSWSLSQIQDYNNYVQQRYSTLPQYQFSSAGPNHATVWTSSAYVNGVVVGFGQGISRMEAKTNAATAALVSARSANGW